MKRILCMLICTLLCIITLSPSMFVSAVDDYCPFSAGKGTGTEADPYQISTAYDLKLLAELINDKDDTEKYSKAFYIQTDDIDLKNELFIPIGTWGTLNVPFQGSYDGNYHTIKQLNINTPDGGYIGLFGIIKNGSITNLSVYGSVKGQLNDGAWILCGGIVGELSEGGSITNCSFTGDVHGDKNGVGGIAGQLVRGGSITSCYFNGNVVSDQSCAGGIVGYLSDHSVVCNQHVVNCYAIGTVSASDSRVGGIIGGLAKNQEDSVYFVDNNYYLDSIISSEANGEMIQGCNKYNAVFMKTVNELLGSPFVYNDNDELNDGYPIFEWQSTPYQFKGSGTENDPYQISNKKELSEFRNLTNSEYFGSIYTAAHYIQVADIDLENENWIPISTFGHEFTGVYNGNYHNIINLNIETDSSYVGLFGRLGERQSGRIKNLSVYGIVNSSTNFVGGICGEVAWNSSIENSSFMGTVKGGYFVGGITGKVYQGGLINSCYSNCIVEGTTSVGGIVGRIEDHSLDATISNCYHVGKTTAQDENEGSIIGRSEMTADSTNIVLITNCYSLNGDSKNNVTVNGLVTGNYTLVETTSQMKGIAKDLGTTYIDNIYGTFNDGYPVFAWQIKIGDCNGDGEFSVLDIVMLQKWLLAGKDAKLNRWYNADLYKDDVIDVFDLVMMKRMLING